MRFLKMKIAVTTTITCLLTQVHIAIGRASPKAQAPSADCISEEYYENMYRYYKHKAAPKVDVLPIIIVLLSVISAFQVSSDIQSGVDSHCSSIFTSTPRTLRW